MSRFICTILLFASVTCSTCLAKDEVIELVIPGPLDGNTVRNPFVEEFLHLIFEIQGYKLNLIYFERDYTQGRALKELSIGVDIDLNWSTTSIERELLLRPIKFPIYQGLIGWRVFFIREADQAKFSTVQELADLRQFVAVQRFDWTDYHVFKENKLPIEGNFRFPQLFDVVEQGLADYFPRSVIEIERESNSQLRQQLVIENSILLKYPAAYYFFVPKDNELLAVMIEKGINKAYQTGQYQKLFDKFFARSIAQLNLDKRKVIHLTHSQINHNALPQNYIQQ